MRLLPSALLATLLSLSALSPASAQSTDARYLAANCANCHGTDGRSAGGSGMPGLAGLSAAYFTEQMNAFRNGSRQATIMHQLAKGYTYAQIAAMAQYFAAQKADK
jgi:cytochrome c553